MNEAIDAVFNFLVMVMEACGAFAITAGALQAIFDYVRYFILNYKAKQVSTLRMRLGQSMVIALEFQVAADILKTGLAPTWEDILLLAAIIGLRTLLNYLLERELEILDPHNEISATSLTNSSTNTAECQ